MNKKTAFLLLFLLPVLSLSAFMVKEDPFLALLKKLEEFTKTNTQEKIHLHLDKPYYAIGDDIWFKAYVVDATTSAPSTISKILYVELINDKDSITKQLKLPVEMGITWGDFKLSDTLKEGNYRIRAYTQWMRNASTAFFFDKTIKIGNSWANEVFTKTNHLLSTDGAKDKVNSTIRFTDKSDKPYANKEVSYEVQVNNKNISRGKQTTNSNGEITIAYTNSSPTVKAAKIIATINLNKEKIIKTIPVVTTANTTDIQFFPEGGTLVEGLPTKVAFKAVNANGLGENISGVILDNDGSEVLKFETTHLGMGSLFLNTSAGKTYTAKVKLANETEKIVPLPKIEKSGYTISINNMDSAKVSIKVLLTADLLNKGELNLVAHHNGMVNFSSKIPTSKQVVTISAEKKDLPSGVLQFTLFNSENIPVSERIIFIDNSNDKIELAIENLKSSYTTREKVDLSFKANNIIQPAQGSFSIAVTNTTAITPDLMNESNILTRLLLTSDISGYVEQPNYYFLDKTEKTKSHLDNLLLTQGWRKINWQQIKSDLVAPPKYQAEKAMSISGKITKGGKPVPNGKVSVFSSSGGMFLIDTLSNDKGEFNFDQVIFTDSTKFVVQARTDKNNKNVQIDLDVVPGQQVTLNKNTGDIEVNINESMATYLKQSDSFFDEQFKKGALDKTIILKEVSIVAKKNPAPNSSNLNGPGNADLVITTDELKYAVQLSNFLMGRVAGVTVRSGKAYLMRGASAPMNIFLDGMNMGSDFMLDDIVVQDIESIEVLKTIGNTAVYGSAGNSGILLITTRRGSAGGFSRYTPGIVTYYPKGYDTVREFYSPMYDVTKDDKPDLRTTIYWNPYVVSDANGKAVLDYYNTDQQGTYRIVIEGMDIFGNLARKIYTYEVK